MLAKGPFDRDPNTYGIRAFESCRARHFSLSKQRQRANVAMANQGASDPAGMGRGVAVDRDFWPCDSFVEEGARDRVQPGLPVALALGIRQA